MGQTPQQGSAKFNCPACGKQYHWKQELAGHEVKCVCGHTLTVAAQAPGHLADTAAAQPAPTDPSADPPAQLGGLLTEAMGGGPSIVEEALINREDEVQRPIFKDRHLPISMAVVGMIATFAFWITVGQTGSMSIGKSILAASLIELSQVLIYLPLGVASAFYVARLFGISFDDLVTTAVKLGGMMIFAGALADSCFFGLLVQSEFDYRVLIIGFTVYIFGFGPLLWWMFGTDLNETMLFVVLLILPRMIVVFTLLPLPMLLMDR